MDTTWPKVVADFETFLQKVGMACRRHEDQAVFGNKILQCENANIEVRVVSDRDVWFVEVADIVTRPNEWYDAAILRDLLLGRGEDVLSLTDQVEIVETNWPAIVGHFSSAQREDTHARLALLRRERAERRFPGLYGPKS